jgi:hypothetical protein
MFFQLGRSPGEGIIGTKIGHDSLQGFRIPTALHWRRFRKGSNLRPATTLGEDLLSYFDFSQSGVPAELFFPCDSPPAWRCIPLPSSTADGGPNCENFVSRLAQFLDNPSLGFGRFRHIPAGVRDKGEHAVYLGFQFRVFLQSFLQAGLVNDGFLDIRKTFCHGFSLR